MAADIQARIVEALLAELKRQASAPDRRLSVEECEPPEVAIEGRVDLDKLTMVVMGSLAGGP